jgi:hypothetical protein
MIAFMYPDGDDFRGPTARRPRPKYVVGVVTPPDDVRTDPDRGTGELGSEGTDSGQPLVPSPDLRIPRHA